MTKPERDRYVDLLRSVSLVVVVIWHWVFTILAVSPETVSPSNPIGSTRGLWVATWVLQVMPVFFFVGGYTHHRSFADYTPGTSRRFLKRRMGRLLGPAVGLVAVWIGIGLLLELTIDPAWTWSAVILVLSPLWFLVIYVVLVLIAPPWPSGPTGDGGSWRPYGCWGWPGSWTCSASPRARGGRRGPISW